MFDAIYIPEYLKISELYPLEHAFTLCLHLQVVYTKGSVSIRPTRSEAISGRLSILRRQRMVLSVGRDLMPTQFSRQHELHRPNTLSPSAVPKLMIGLQVFLTWLPHSQGCLQEDGTFVEPSESQRSPMSVGASPSSAADTRLACRSARSADMVSTMLTDRTMYAVHPLPLGDIQALRKHVPSFGRCCLHALTNTNLLSSLLSVSNLRSCTTECYMQLTMTSDMPQ